MHPRSISMFLCVIVAALALTRCGGGGGSTPAAPSSPPPSSPPTGTGATVNIPSSDGYGTSTFTPGNVTIPPGASVTWSNQDTVAHVSAASTGNLWTATIDPGGSFTRTFTDKGTFNYRCTIHQGMSGTVTVQ